MNSTRIKLLEKYAEEEPENPFNKYALAMEYYDLAPEKSVEILSNLADQHPNYLPTYYKLAHLLWDLEVWDSASTFFKKGIEIATRQSDEKALKELNAAFQNFLFEMD
ncbi:MAG: tetratricopeptide repeat protein [Bacteroidota bacterium]